MRHAICALVATALAASLAVAIHFFSVHDIGGFYAIIIGYPGIVAITVTNLENGKAEALIALVNWLFYFGLLEAVWQVFSRYRRQTEI